MDNIIQNRNIISYSYGGTSARAKRPRWRPITKKIWEAIEARKFGYDVTVRINLWFLNKKFQEIIYLSMFIHNISSKRDRETTGG